MMVLRHGGARIKCCKTVDNSTWAATGAHLDTVVSAEALGQ